MDRTNKDSQKALNTQVRFYQESQFKQMFKQDLDLNQQKHLDDNKVYGFDDFFSKIEKFFTNEEDQQKFEFFKFVSKSLQKDVDKLIPILNKLNEKKIFSQQAFSQSSNINDIGIDNWDIEKIRAEMNSSQKSFFNTSQIKTQQQQNQQQQQPSNTPQTQQLQKQTQTLSQQQQQPSPNPQRLQNEQQQNQLKQESSQQQQQRLQQSKVTDQKQQSEKNQITDYLNELKKNCQKVSSSNLKQINGFQKIVYQYTGFQQKDLQNLNNYKTILVIGQKGCGKSSFLNYLLNVYLGVQYEDDFRFIFQKSDQPTNDISVRYIQQFREKAGLILIDTPGFNDDLDQKKQPSSIEKIFTYLQNDQKIDCICLVLEANIIRLTKEQNQFFEKVIRYFGKDALTNFKFIFTQSLDDNLPKSMQAIKFKGDQQHQESPFAQHYDQIKSPIYFKVNCQNILSYNEIQDLEDYFWKMTYKSIVEFFGEISILLPVQSSKFAFIEKNKYMNNIQRLLVEICKFKESSLKTKEKQQTQPFKGQNKQGEEQRMKKIVLENRKKFSLQKLELKEEIQNYCKLSLETFIDYTEVLKDQYNPKDISHKKIMVNIIESLQEDYFMYEAKLPQK